MRTAPVAAVDDPPPRFHSLPASCACPASSGPEAAQPVGPCGATRQADVHSHALPFASVDGRTGIRAPVCSLVPHEVSAAAMDARVRIVATERLRTR